VAKVIGINKKITSHVGRKTAAMKWLNAGISSDVIARMLGHSSTRETQSRYAKVQVKRIQEEVASLMAL
jgi:integrase/recombinase XerD